MLLALFLTLSVCWCSGAYAYASSYLYFTVYQNNTYTYGTTAQGTADAYCAKMFGAGTVASSNPVAGQAFTCPGKAFGTTLFYDKRCGDGSLPDTNKPADQQCGVAAPPVCTDASVKSKYLGAGALGTSITGSPPATICVQGCSYAAGQTSVLIGTQYSVDIGLGTGSACSGSNYDTIDTTTKPTDPPSLRSCAQKGMTYGTVNGVGICAKAGTIPNSTVTQNTSNTVTGTSASGVQGTPSTTSDSLTVSNVNGVPTVTDTKTNPDGSKTTTTTDQPSYCMMNPTASVCKESQSNVSGGGDCAAAPVCQGDAVQCAMVNQQWHTRCDSNQQSAMSDLGNQILAGNDPAASSNPVTHRTSNNISSSIDQSTFLTGGVLADKVVTVHGNAITLPFSRLNQYLVWLGHIFVVMSLIGAIRIVLGGFK